MILENRLATLTKIIRHFHDVFDKYSSVNTLICQDWAGRSIKCDALHSGLAVQELKKLDIWPGDPAEIAYRIHGTTVQSLVEAINNLEDHEFIEIKPAPKPRIWMHRKCGFVGNLQTLVMLSLEETVSGLLETYKSKLEEQREKLQPYIQGQSSATSGQALW